MHTNRLIARGLFLAFAVLSLAGPAGAQQVTGVLGSPSATTTLSGKQLPPPDPKFAGVSAAIRKSVNAGNLKAVGFLRRSSSTAFP